MSSAAVVISPLRVKHWPADPVVLGSKPAEGWNRFKFKEGSIAQSHLLNNTLSSS